MSVMVQTRTGGVYLLAEKYDAAVAFNGMELFSDYGWYECPSSDGQLVTWVKGSEIVAVTVADLPEVER